MEILDLVLHFEKDWIRGGGGDGGFVKREAKEVSSEGGEGRERGREGLNGLSHFVSGFTMTLSSNSPFSLIS